MHVMFCQSTVLKLTVAYNLSHNMNMFRDSKVYTDKNLK